MIFSQNNLRTLVSHIVQLILTDLHCPLLLPIDGYSVGEHPIIARLLKGMFHACPPEPGYNFIWDVNVLLTFLESWFPLPVLELKQLHLRKTVT